MSGSILGPDQIRKINAAFPALVAHIRTLLEADHTGVGLMRVHCMVESFDSDEMERMFREISYISPLEKKALVRAAIYELLAKEPALFVSPEVFTISTTATVASVVTQDEAKTYTPPQFKLNVATSGAAEMAKSDTKPEPVVTSTHKSVVSTALDKGAKQSDDLKTELSLASIEAVKKTEEQQAKMEAAVAKLREATKPISIPVIPEDATIPQE